MVSFCAGTQQTEKQKATLCPTWDQTLIFDDVQLAGPVLTTRTQAPQVVVEVFDWDARVRRHNQTYHLLLLSILMLMIIVIIISRTDYFVCLSIHS